MRLVYVYAPASGGGTVFYMYPRLRWGACLSIQKRGYMLVDTWGGGTVSCIFQPGHGGNESVPAGRGQGRFRAADWPIPMSGRNL